jgi:hypothetical protein
MKKKDVKEEKAATEKGGERGKNELFLTNREEQYLTLLLALRNIVIT